MQAKSTNKPAPRQSLSSLFRADGTVEEVLQMDGWAPGEFMEDIIDGSFQYGAITEEAALKFFPKGFN